MCLGPRISPLAGPVWPVFLGQVCALQLLQEQNNILRAPMWNHLQWNRLSVLGQKVEEKTHCQEHTSAFLAQTLEAVRSWWVAGLDQVWGTVWLMKYLMAACRPCPLGPSSPQGTLIKLTLEEGELVATFGAQVQPEKSPFLTGAGHSRSIRSDYYP